MVKMVKQVNVKKNFKKTKKDFSKMERKKRKYSKKHSESEDSATSSSSSEDDGDDSSSDGSTSSSSDFISSSESERNAKSAKKFRKISVTAIPKKPKSDFDKRRETKREAVKANIKYLELKDVFKNSMFIGEKTYKRGVRLLESKLLTLKQEKTLLALLEKHNSANDSSAKSSRIQDDFGDDDGGLFENDHVLSIEQVKPALQNTNVEGNEVDLLNNAYDLDLESQNAHKKKFYDRYHSKEFKGFVFSTFIS